jgi:hypothetical protein
VAGDFVVTFPLAEPAPVSVAEALKVEIDFSPMTNGHQTVLAPPLSVQVPPPRVDPDAPSGGQGPEVIVP